ncbi:hypothetical protein [Breoghania sp.]|uniref:hypothetical protein n=1 Tax=Breoghania sp. TaxID=2065378 RepID=UPI002AAB6FAE|nr:hypothetical protein [Breoghania sp.]
MGPKKRQALELDTIAAHEPRLRDHEEQKVKLTQAFWHLRKPAVDATASFS